MFFKRLKQKLFSKKMSNLKMLNSNKVAYMESNPEYQIYSVGRFTYGNPKVLSWGENSTLKVGSFCSIADGVKILLGGNHRTEWVTTYPFNIIFDNQEIVGHPATNGDVIIGNDVWIGMDSIILSGVSIGDGSVVAARSVVTKSIDPYTIVGGNPAKVIRKRFSDDIIASLLSAKWWEWEIDRIQGNMSSLLSSDLHNFISISSSFYELDK